MCSKRTGHFTLKTKLFKFLLESILFIVDMEVQMGDSMFCYILLYQKYDNLII